MYYIVNVAEKYEPEFHRFVDKNSFIKAEELNPGKAMLLAEIAEAVGEINSVINGNLLPKKLNDFLNEV